MSLSYAIFGAGFTSVDDLSNFESKDLEILDLGISGVDPIVVIALDGLNASAPPFSFFSFLPKNLSFIFPFTLSFALLVMNFLAPPFADFLARAFATVVIALIAVTVAVITAILSYHIVD